MTTGSGAAIDAVRPRIVVCEYNSNFGPDRSVTVPYDPEFRRTQAHYSNLYFGASLAALCKLAREKGYDFVGSNSAGNNAYFVRNDVSHFFPILSPSGGYVVSRFRESRDREGRLSFLDPARRIAEIGELPVLDLDLQTIIPVRALVTTVSPDWRVSVETQRLVQSGPVTALRARAKARKPAVARG